MLEGELSDSCDSFHSIEMPSSTTQKPAKPVSNWIVSKRSVLKEAERLTLKEVEKSYIEMHLMDVDSDPASANGVNGVNRANGVNGINGVPSTGKTKGYAAAQNWQRVLLQDKKRNQQETSDGSNKKAVIRTNPRQQRVVIVDPKSPTNLRWPPTANEPQAAANLLRPPTANELQPAANRSQPPTANEPQPATANGTQPATNKQQPTVSKVQKAVFTNHRRLEKREFGQFVKSPPKPAEVKLSKKDVSDYSRSIAAALKEKRQDIIQKIIDACGIEKCSQLCTEAQLIYNTTGMLTLVGTPRTLGGCFFQLVKMKGDLSDSQKRAIFYEPTSKLSLQKKQKRNAKRKNQKLKKTQEELRNVFEQMNLDIHVSIKSAE